ncbi:hypothetical protein FAM15347_001749 [Propionibacterium freudenreichii]|uniref:sigma factor-like helix-turn-helix DNA-binding protein n=1 Tax=Propionibacterium freudenreichii TaxID=1744 RepID=UPI00254D4872|nr:sigma factor-like helix-turn-helix DNA-binding protein [Propionibacterium freudenreichii]MDK9660422.1 hypothetical protein [Propionibacterium freudenreichii]
MPDHARRPAVGRRCQTAKWPISWVARWRPCAATWARPGASRPINILEQTIPDERPVHDVSFLSELADQERRVLELNFGIRNGRAQTLVQIAEHMGMSVSAVSRLKQRALRRGRALVHAELAA